MKAITIAQPHASLLAARIIAAVKRTEPTAYRGPIAIHAATLPSATDQGDVDHLVHRLGSRSLPRGEIIAVATLITVTEPQRDGWYWYVFADVQRLRCGVSAAGRLGIWIVPDAVAQVVDRALTQQVLQ